MRVWVHDLGFEAVSSEGLGFRWKVYLKVLVAITKRGYPKISSLQRKPTSRPTFEPSSRDCDAGRSIACFGRDRGSCPNSELFRR